MPTLFVMLVFVGVTMKYKVVIMATAGICEDFAEDNAAATMDISRAIESQFLASDISLSKVLYGFVTCRVLSNA